MPAPAFVGVAPMLPPRKRPRLPESSGVSTGDAPPTADSSSASSALRASESTDRVQGDAAVAKAGESTRLSDEATKVGHVEASLGSSIASQGQPLYRASRGRHAEDPAQGPVGPTTPAAVLSEDELKARLLQICTGSGERPAATAGLRSMPQVTVNLIQNVMAAVTALMGTHAKPGPYRAEMVRCCGDLDNEEARGYLVNDAVGRPLLYRDDDRAENHARDVGKRVWNAASKAQRDMAAQKERDAAAVRAAKRAAEKDSTKAPAVGDAERARDAARAGALAAPVELDLPAVTVGSKLIRSTHTLMCEHQKAAARKAAAEAAYNDADLKQETFRSIYYDIHAHPGSGRLWQEKGDALDRWRAAAETAVRAQEEWVAALDACAAAHDRHIAALEAEVAEAEDELAEVYAFRDRAMYKAALDALFRQKWPVPSRGSA